MKTTEEIYSEMQSEFQRRTGYAMEDSCDLAVRLYAVAAQIQALQYQAEWVSRQCFPQTAEESYLDEHAQIRGLERIPATTATGTLRFLSDSAQDRKIPVGTVCLTEEGVRYETTESAVLEAEKAFVDVPAHACNPGADGNTPAGTICWMTVPPAGIAQCTNPTAFSGGADAEKDEMLRRRILESYRRLPNGANAAFYEEQALCHTGVAAAKAVGRARGIGTVDVYIAAPSGTPSQTLLEEVRAEIEQKREIAVDVSVLAPTEKIMAISAALATEDGASFSEVSTAVRRTLENYFTGKQLGRGISRAQLGALIYGVEGVANYHLTAPAADLAVADTVLPVLGTVTLTQLKE